MLLIEQIDDINTNLLRDYGRELDGRASFRIVWSDDQLEKRRVKNINGVELLFEEVREMLKYDYIKGRYILERIVNVMELDPETDLVEKMPYEVLWVFMDRRGDYLPPRTDACRLVIDQLLVNMDSSDLHGAYKDSSGIYKKYNDPEDSEEVREAKIQEMEDYLFGDETPVGDALAYKSGVTVPEMPKGE